MQRSEAFLVLVGRQRVTWEVSVVLEKEEVEERRRRDKCQYLLVYADAVFRALKGQQPLHRFVVAFFHSCVQWCELPLRHTQSEPGNKDKKTKQNTA